METNRKHKREWGVYDQQMYKFYNMDCTSIFEDQHFEDTPIKGYTYEEAQRFIVHCDNKQACKIVNIKQPKYLLNFEVDFYRKEQASNEAKENLSYQNNARNIQNESILKRDSKQQFFAALSKYKAESLKPMDGVQSLQLEELKPKIEDYSLTSNDFDMKEKSQLISHYNVTL